MRHEVPGWFTRLLVGLSIAGFPIAGVLPYASTDLPTRTYVVAASRSGHSDAYKSASVGAGALAIADFVLSQTSQTAPRDPALWPFDKLSPWNRPLGANAVYQPIQGGLGGGFAKGSLHYQAWTLAIWIAGSQDPIRKIYLERWNGELKPPDFFIARRIPDAATATSDTDRRVALIAPDHLTAVELYRATKRPDGNWNAQTGKELDLKGDGRYGIWASGMADVGGVIRAGELQTGIKHALAFATDAKMWNRYAPGGKPYVWPAKMADRYALEPEPRGYGSSGNLYMGSWVALPPTENVSALGLETPEGLLLAQALQVYGAIGSNTNRAGDKITFNYDYAAYLSGVAPAANMDAFKRDLDRIARKLKVVANSHTNGQAPTLDPTEGVGGGKARTSVASPFSGSSKSTP